MKVEISKDELEALDALTNFVIKSNGTLQLMIKIAPGMDQFLSLDEIMEANLVVATCYQTMKRIKAEAKA